MLVVISHAFSVLSDPEKRRKYDLSETGSQRHGNDCNNHDFESDMTADDIFNMFFADEQFTNGDRFNAT